MRFKKFTKILCCSLLALASFSGCKKEEKEEKIDLNGDKGELSTCQVLEKQGEDLNLAGCLYQSMPEGTSVIFYLPANTFDEDKTSNIESNKWARVKGFNSFVMDDDYNVDYFIEVIEKVMLDYYEPSSYTVDESTGTIHIDITGFMTDAFDKQNGIQVEEGDSKKYLEASQVIAQCLADTLYQAFPDLNVEFGIYNLRDIVPIKDGIVISKSSYLPYFFGSENNYVGDTSFSEYVSILASKGVTFDAYGQTPDLLVVNSFLYSSMMIEDGRKRDNVQEEVVISEDDPSMQENSQSAQSFEFNNGN